jgi:hypothetical protein
LGCRSFGSRQTPIERRKAVDQEPTAAFSIDRDTLPVAPRIGQRERSDQVVAMGLRAGWMKDLYHYLLVLPL